MFELRFYGKISKTFVEYNWSNFSGTGNGMHTPTTLPSAVYRMPPPTAGGINEPQECPYCRRTFSCYYSLKRHFQDKHEQSDTLYVCEFCNRRYRTKNSLTTHKSLQHRGSSGMLKRLLKTSAIKNVLAQHPQIPQQPQWKLWYHHNFLSFDHHHQLLAGNYERTGGDKSPSLTAYQK